MESVHVRIDKNEASSPKKIYIKVSGKNLCVGLHREKLGKQT